MSLLRKVILVNKITIKFHKSLKKFTNGNSFISIPRDHYRGLFLACINLFPELYIFCREASITENKRENLLFIVNNKMVDESLEYVIPTSNEIVLCPIIRGKGGSSWSGIALTLILYIAPPAAFKYGLTPFGIDFKFPEWFSTVVNLGTNLLWNKITDELDPKPIRRETSEGGANRAGTNFNNVTNDPPFSPVGLHYGNVRVSGVYISGSILTVNHGQDSVVRVGNYFG